jgi:MFS family permease
LYLTLLETGALILSLFFVGLSFGGSSPLVSALLEARGESEYFTGGVVAMLALGLAIMSPIAGKLVDRFGPRPVNVAGLLLQGVGFAALGGALWSDVRLLLAARLWLGVAASLTFVAAEYALLKGTRASHRGRVMAAYGAAFGLGFMVGVFVGNRAFDRLGLLSFVLPSGIAVAIAPLAFWAMRGLARPESRLAREKDNEERSRPLPVRPLLLAMYGAVVYAVLDIAMTGTYPIEGQRLGLSRESALDVVGWMAFGTIAVQPLAGSLADRLGTRRVLYALSALGALSSLAAGALSARGFPEALVPATAAFVLVGAAVGGIFPVSLSLLGERTPPELLSRANAVYSTVFGYASLIGPVVAASFIDVAQRVGLLGWAVPSLAFFTFGAALPLARIDRRSRGGRLESGADVIQDHDTLALPAEPESNGP